MATDVIFRLAAIAKRQRRIGALQEKIESLRERNDYELEELLKDLGVGKRSLNDRLGGFVGPTQRREKMVKEILAQKGAFLLEIVPGSNGDVIVRIDEGPPFPLSALLGELLLFLATAEKSPDDKVGWRSRSDIAKHLAKAKGGRPPKRHAVNNLIHRLRDALEAHGENDRFVHSSRTLGYRFALRRNGRIVFGQSMHRKDKG